MKQFIEENIDYVTFPCLISFLIGYDHAKLSLAWVFAFGGGWVLWTFAEYVIHRWVLHTFYWMGIHERHHARPLELTHFPLWQIPSYFVVIGALFWAAAGDAWVPMFAGFAAGYVTFVAMHGMQHHFPGYLPAFAVRHNAHHKTTTCNYGISVDWWDRIFGTYRASRSSAGASVWVWRALLALLIGYVLMMLSMTRVHAMDHGFDPNDPRTKWMEQQKQPDTGASCCGKADGYFVDRWQMNPDGSAEVWIEDSGDVTFPDGTLRPRIVDRWFHVPREKVNSLTDDLDNPFDHSVLWVRAIPYNDNYTIYCFVRHPNGS